MATQKHLICHLWPKTDQWGPIVCDFVSHWHLWDRKVFAVATSPDAATFAEIRATLPDDAELFELPNDPTLREVASWRSLWERIENEPGHVFCAHGKGSTHVKDSICQEWRRVMLEVLLNAPDLLQCALARFPIVGSCRRYGGLTVPWHYSGTFFWCDIPRCRERARDIEQTWHGTESWPGRHFAAANAACLFLEDCGDLYCPEYWSGTVRPAVDRWRRKVQECLC